VFSPPFDAVVAKAEKVFIVDFSALVGFDAELGRSLWPVWIVPFWGKF